MKFNELKSGYTVVLADDCVYTVWNRYNDNYELETYFVDDMVVLDVTNSYDNDSMEFIGPRRLRDIQEVYACPVNPKDKFAIIQGRHKEIAEEIFDMCLWSRPARRRVTRRQIEERLGYPIEIIEEE